MKKIYLIVFFYCLLSPLVGWAADSPCADCHEDVAEKSRGYRYVHQPFIEGQCGQCHIVGNSVTPAVNKSALVVEKEQLEQIRWFKSVSGRELEHWQRLPADKVSGSLFVKATDGRMRSPLLRVAVPKSGLAQKNDDHQAPVQTNLTVSDVRRGISTTATVQWQTDEFTDSIIYYGVDGLRSVKAGRQLARRHSQILLGLEADKVYQCQIISRDLFGNETRSPILTFATSKSYLAPDSHYSSDSTISSEIKLQWQLFRVSSDFLLVVHSDRPVSLSLGTESIAQDQTAVERQVVVSGSFSHPILKSSLDTNISICKDCHQGVRDEYSHPIKVRAPRGMVIPLEYPLLPDGTLSCMSCHASHASNSEYRLLKSRKADLCRGCHTDY